MSDDNLPTIEDAIDYAIGEISALINEYSYDGDYHIEAISMVDKLQWLLEEITGKESEDIIEEEAREWDGYADPNEKLRLKGNPLKVYVPNGIPNREEWERALEQMHKMRKDVSNADR